MTDSMTDVKQKPGDGGRRRRSRLLAAGVLLCAAAGGLAWLLLRPQLPAPEPAGTDVPLGVEQAVIIRCSGPLKAMPFRRGASVSLRIADEVQRGSQRVYDIRYVVNLPGDFDLSEYLTSADGRPRESLPPFRVRGLTSLSQDLETRIREIDRVGIHFWHGYFETLASLGALWLAWLLGLIFVGRRRHPRRGDDAGQPPTVGEQIEGYLATLARGELTTAEKAQLEVLLLKDWRDRLGLSERRMAAACRDIEASDEAGRVYGELRAWLHDPRSGIGGAEFVQAFRGAKADDRPRISR